MAAHRLNKREPSADPKALREGIDLIKELKPMLEIMVREDLSEEERGLLIHKRFPPEIMKPLMARIDAVRLALPGKEKYTGRPNASGS